MLITLADRGRLCKFRTSERNEGNQGKWNFNKNLLRLFSVASCVPNLNNSYSFEYYGKSRRCIFKSPCECTNILSLCLLAIVPNACARFHRTGDQVQPWRITVVAGNLKISQMSETGQKRGVNEIHVHAEFNPKTLENDVALLAVRSFESTLLFQFSFHFHVLIAIILSRRH